jgi:hypothetical protein
MEICGTFPDARNFVDSPRSRPGRTEALVPRFERVSLVGELEAALEEHLGEVTQAQLAA